MNRWLRLGSLLLLAGVGAGTGPRAAEPGLREPVKVKATLPNDQKITVEFLGRDKSFVLFREAGKQQETGFKPSGFKWVDFGINLETNGVNALYRKEDYKAVAEQLNKLLGQLFMYLDLPSDLPQQSLLLLKCLYWTDKYADTITLSNVIANNVTDDNIRREAQLYKVLAALARGERWEAGLLLKSIGTVNKTNEIAGMYFYATAQVQLAQTNWFAAQESSARVVGFCPRDEDWMPPALLLSAKCYAHDKKYAVAIQTLNEIGIAYRKTRWAQQAKSLLPEYQRLLEQYQAEHPEQQMPEERQQQAKDLLK